MTGFLEENLEHFSTESIRNALKYTPEATRRKYLDGMKAAQEDHAARGALHRR
jgi:hypothetical protein